ncbi:MAG TPA: glycosyltransferase, partial [Solirubrobacterales bacterium]|nr:glycosyltransferase [Solirubrobacterales bacterium]
ILFVTSNGTGLGHLSRSMAIAKRLDPTREPLFVTFSAAAPAVRELGFPVEYVASYDRPGAGNDWRWTRRVRARLEAIVSEVRPEVVAFDGTHPYERLLPALRSSGAALVWCRRAMWRRDSDTAPLWRSHLFDAVLEPGEYAAAADTGPTVARRGEAHRVDPVVLLDRSDLLPRDEAERELGLEPGRTNVLVQLGQGDGVRAANRRCLRHLAARPEVQVAALASALATLDEVPDGVLRLRGTYPVSRYLAAFDVAVAAAGYNAYHELIHLGVPALYVPMPRQTDDQAARARYASESGVGVAVAGPDDPALEARLDDLLDPVRRDAIRERLASVELANGAADAARWLEELGAGPAPPSGPAASGRRRPPSRAARVRRAWIFAASVPPTVVRLARQVLTRPRVRTVVIALGFERDDLAGPLAGALERAGERPERALVVTDSLDFGPLLALGVGFEHVPGPRHRHAELAGGDYERFASERVRLILADRPRRRRVLTLGHVPAAVLGAAQPSRR